MEEEERGEDFVVVDGLRCSGLECFFTV